MKLNEARDIINQVDSKSYWWMKAWGISTIREAIRTIQDRKASTKSDKYRADVILNNILRKE